MAQFARPVTPDQNAGLWTVTPLATKVDEGAPGDGTVVTSDAVGNNAQTSVATLDLSPVTDPAVSTGHVLRVRWRQTDAARTLDGSVQLRQGLGFIATLFTAGVPGSSTTLTVIEKALTVGETDAITNYSNLNVQIWGNGTSGGPARSLEVDFVELEVPDANVEVDVGAALTATATVTAEADAFTPREIAADGHVALNGTDQWIDLGSVPSLSFLTLPMAMYVEFRMPAGADPGQIIDQGVYEFITGGNSFQGWRWTLGNPATSNAVLAVVEIDSGGTLDDAGLTTITDQDDGQWHRVLMVFEATIARCYLDGEVVHESFPAGSDIWQTGPSDRCSIGAVAEHVDDTGTYVQTPDDFWDGDLANVAVWNVAITAEDELALAQGKVAPDAVAGLEGWWPLDFNARDLGPNSLDGAPLNDPTFTGANEAALDVNASIVADAEIQAAAAGEADAALTATANVTVDAEVQKSVEASLTGIATVTPGAAIDTPPGPATPLVVTARQSANSGITAEQSITTSAATPTADSLFLVFAAVENDGHEVDPDWLSITGGLLSYTKITNINGIPWDGIAQFGLATVCWRAPVGPSPSAFAVTVDPWTGSQDGFQSALCLDVTGHDDVNPIVQSATNGASSVGGAGSSITGTVTLPGTPVVGNLVVVEFAAGADGGGGFAPPTLGGQPMTLLIEHVHEPFVQADVWYRTIDGTETDDTITCTDVGDTVGNWAAMAVEIAAAPSTGAVEADAAFTATATITATADVEVPIDAEAATAISAGIGADAAVATPTTTAVGATAGLTADAAVSTPVDSSLAATANISATAETGVAVDADQVAEATITAEAAADAQAQASLNVAAGISAVTKIGSAIGAALNVSASITTSAEVVTPADTAVAVTAALTAEASVTEPAQAARTVIAEITAEVSTGAAVDAALTMTAEITAISEALLAIITGRQVSGAARIVLPSLGESGLTRQLSGPAQVSAPIPGESGLARTVNGPQTTTTVAGPVQIVTPTPGGSGIAGTVSGPGVATIVTGPVVGPEGST